jgi:hypothetical protein
MTPAESALSRARLFIDMAATFPVNEQAKCAACVEAAIVYMRTALHRTQHRFCRAPGWTVWWRALAGDTSLEFIRRERDLILKEADPQVTLIGYVGFGVPLDAAARFCYFPDEHVIDTLNRLLRRMTEVVNDAQARFG